jgi:hypothetical protein
MAELSGDQDRRSGDGPGAIRHLAGHLCLMPRGGYGRTASLHLMPRGAYALAATAACQPAAGYRRGRLPLRPGFLAVPEVGQHGQDATVIRASRLEFQLREDGPHLTFDGL